MVPKTIKCKEQVFDVSFHPENDLVAAALIDGTVELWRHTRGEVGSDLKNLREASLQLHTGSCRGLQFNSSGDRLFTVSADRSWRAVDVQGKVVLDCQGAHNSAINKLRLINENLLATGDDNGVVRLWDSRAHKSAVMSWDAHTDFVADLDFHDDSHALFSASGDATLCVYDIRNEKHFYKSDDQEAELHCVRVMRDGKKVVCGSQDGVLIVFQSGQWGDCSDRFPGHPETVDCMWKVDESTLVTGSSDGLIRVVSLFPNKVLGVVGDHKKFPVEQIQANHDRSLLASLAHDEKIRFWDISLLQDDEDDGEVDEDEDEEEGSDDEQEGNGSDSDEELEQAEGEDIEGEAAEEDSASQESDGDEDSDSASDDSDEEESDESEESDSDNEKNEEEETKPLKKSKVDSRPTSSSAVTTSEKQTDTKSVSKTDTKSKPTRQAQQSQGEGQKKKQQRESDSDDDSDDSSAGPQRKKIPTAAEKFYADL